MKRVFNKEKFIKDLEQLNPWICEISKPWIEMCDGREVINGIVLGDKGEEYLVANDWTDVVDDEKITIDKQNNEKPVTKKVFSRDLYIGSMDKCVPAVDHSKTSWAIDCDGAEVINGYAHGKKGATYVVDDEWTKEVPVEGKEVPVEAEESETEPKKEVKQKTKKIFSKDKYLKTGGEYYKWVDDCDWAEVINGMAIGKSGKKFYMSDDWTIEVPVTTNGYKIEIECNDNKTTVAILYKNGEKIDEAIARCSDRDTFDLFKGATLALNRLLL